MRPLYEIGQDLLAAYAAIEADVSDSPDPDCGMELADSLTPWFDALATEEATKLDNYVGLIKTLEMEAVAAKAEAEQWLQKAKTREASIAFLKRRMLQHLVVTGRESAITATGRKIRIQANGGVVPLIITDGTEPTALPTEFQKVKVEIATDAVRKALVAGRQLGFATLGERGQHLRIA